MWHKEWDGMERMGAFPAPGCFPGVMGCWGLRTHRRLSRDPRKQAGETKPSQASFLGLVRTGQLGACDRPGRCKSLGNQAVLGVRRT